MKITSRNLVRNIMDRLPPRVQSRLMSFRSRASAQLGRGTYVHHSVQLLGKAFIRIGDNSVLSQECWLNVNHRHGEQLAINIGDHCFIGRRNFFSSGKRIVVGHYVLTANDCHFLGSSHVINNPMQPCIITGTTDTHTIIVGHNTFIGAGVTVLGNVTIGHGCVIGARSLVTHDVPPFSQVSGSPATVRRRFSFLRKTWVNMAEFTAEDAAALPDADHYLVDLRKTPVPRMPYLAAGSDLGNL